MVVWILFIGAVLLFLALDLGFFNKTPHIISSKEAGIWTSIWVTLSLAFSGVIYWLYQNQFCTNPDALQPETAVLKYISGYLVELSLSADNIFVMAVIFSSFKIAKKYQHRVLFWGIIGAIIFRGLMILFGVVLIHKIHWITYVFGGFLVFTAVKMLFKKEEQEFNPKESFVYKMIGKIIPISHHRDREHFFITENQKTYATTLFVTLLVIEVMDVVFATDSVPAILSITSDPFLVFSSNIFAILGLRSMYFFLANMLDKFHYLEYSLIAILSFVGVKMLLVHFYKFPEWVSLAFIALALTAGVVLSLAYGKESHPSRDEE
ncbi:TerC family protein [Flavobacterium aciduliphilum]|nr:TerC family protein [Flavobacterium aciduliphilum]